MLIRKNVDNTVRWKPGERLDHYYEQICDQVPADHQAVVTEEVSLTFRELDARANQTARWLIAKGVRPGDRIGVLFDKSIHGHVTLLAIMKAGAAYVPLDPSFPSDRVAYIIEDAGIKRIASVSRYADKLAEFPVERLLMDTVGAEIDPQPSERLTGDEKPSPEADQLFYLIYTSGTTGKPKGVAIDHSGICNFVRVAGETYGYEWSDRCYQGMTLAFDFHVEDLWTPLINGATLIAGKSGASLFGADLHAFLTQQRITVLPCVPTLWATIEEDVPAVRIILLSGEAVPHNLVVRWHKPGRSILNAYGPTECSVSATIRFLTPENPVTIGIPLPTYTVVIIDENNPIEMADGEIGEIGIAGICLARGYLNREELTAQKFIPDFIGLPNNPSQRIYRTGDYGRIRDDGELEYHGRIDTQVKLRGYRIELGEIEAVLGQMPEVAQAVVNPYETAPGTTELVAYYTRKQGAPELDLVSTADNLRRQLPPYMVPSYLEEVPFIPMTTNNKADRRALPAPKGPRFSVSTTAFVAPRDETETALVGALTSVMNIEKASVTDNFFQDLGAHSLLMARFGAEIRKRMNIPAVSMRDIYLNPTIEKLAEHVKSLGSQSIDDDRPVVSNRANFHHPSDFAYWLCGALQALWLIATAVIGIYVTVATLAWSYAAMPDLVATYFRIVVVTIGLALAATLLAVVAKWVLVGRWKAQVIDIWSLNYFRFWVVKSLVRSAPVGLFPGPIYNAFLRLLGAKVGQHALIRPRYIPIATDLLSIGDDAVVGKEAVINGYKAQSNRIHIGPISIGNRAYIGEGAIIDINTVMEDDTQLAQASSLHDGQSIPKGQHVHGCPAQPTTANYCKIETRPLSNFRIGAYAAAQLVTAFALAPLPVLFLMAIFPFFSSFIGMPDLEAATTFDQVAHFGLVYAPISLALYLGGVIVGLLYIGVAPRILNLFLKPDKTYTLYGFHYFIHQTIVRISNSAFYNNLFGDSTYIPYYQRWIGWKINTIIQTGSNFGSDHRHDNPFLVDLGTGTMVSGGLKVINETMSNSSFKVSKVKIGENNYLGNYIRIPADSKVGANVLVGTKMLVPIDGPVRENVGLLGSPSFEIPRMARRDLEMSNNLDEATRKLRLRQKTWYNIASSTLFLLNNWFLAYAVTLIGIVALTFYPELGVVAMVVAGAAGIAFTVAWGWLVERMSLKFGRLKPQIALVLDPYYWFHERHKLVSLLHFLEPAVAGTPFKNIVSRLEGVRVGKKVFDDGFEFNEYTLITIGDETNLNLGGLIQPHTLEEAVFKSDYVVIGKGCTLHTASNIHYGVTFGDYVVLEPNTFVMKGEIADDDTTWRGNPARSAGVPQPVVHITATAA
jgi:non-ribosomal peptide synthetase-like protein